jgi:Flp pilus assembly protein TadG
MWSPSHSVQKHTAEHGQALVIFVAGLVAFLGLVALSIDVGRYLWARTQMQSAVDATALAAAQSMPVSPGEAEDVAFEYWDKNNDALTSQGTNVALTVTFPPGNKAVLVKGDADIPTIFARVLGFNKFHVSAQGTAASQVLDISLVLDVSGSMCFTSNPPADGQSGTLRVMGHGHGAVAGGFARPTVATAIPASTANTGVQIVLNDVRIFDQTSASNNRANFGNWWPSSGTNRYWSYDPDGASVMRAGMIMIGSELMRITALNVATNTLTVTRAMTNLENGLVTVKGSHPVGSQVKFFINGSGSETYCAKASPNVASPSTNGPHQPFDAMIDNSQYFTTLFNGAYDRIGLASYSTTAKNQNGLTGTLSSISAKLNGSGAAEFVAPDGGTNIAHGLAVGRHILDGPGKRDNAVRVLVILTDGVPNQYCSNASAYSTPGASCTAASATTPGTCPASSTGISHAIAQATAAKNANITVYAIGLGDGVLDCILESIATAGGGTYFKAPTPAQLDEAFAAIASKTRVSLTQ